ncbi:MAG: hypothetical protein NT166_28880 [Candidatus Aminicenantes bacterium]|nr:hypothetical protein [Candidatus Aminicenantes bacterium]
MKGKINENVENLTQESPMDEKDKEKEKDPLPESISAFMMMPFGSDKKDPDQQEKKDTVSKGEQEALYYLTIFGLNDAYYQNYKNNSVKKWKPINLERADIGAGWSADLLENVFLKITKSDFCVTDCTFKNMNVALECGYAIANNKFIIPIKRPIDDLQIDETHVYSSPNISDLAGKLMQVVRTKPLMDHEMWPVVFERMKDPTKVVFNQAKYFYQRKDNIEPFLEKADSIKTFLFQCVCEKPEPKDYVRVKLEEFETLYREHIVRPLYSVIRPLSEKLDSGATEVEYTCQAYATRDDANFSDVFSSARKRIKILTTNLQGLTGYIGDIAIALEKNEFKLEVLTLNPDSEFVNSRGKLIGKEIRGFRTEMSNSLEKFKKQLGIVYDSKVSIKIYSEFPTQITYFVDDDVYSSVVSVNHQSRQNIVFKVPISRKGVAESFLQHWDTIWARATEVLSPQTVLPQSESKNSSECVKKNRDGA